MKIYRGLALLLPAIVLVAVWSFAVEASPRLAYFIGSPISVASYLVDGVASGWMLRDFAVTGAEAGLGFLIGNILGVAVGIALWWLPAVERVVRGYIAALGAAPLFAASPLLILWFGTGYPAKVATSVLSTVFVALAHSSKGLSSIPRDHLRLVAAFGGGKRELFRFVAIPILSGWMSPALRLNVGFAILGAFLGEFLSAEFGLGKRILVATGLFDMSLVLSGILGLVALAGVFYALVAAYENVLHRVLRS